MTIRVALSEYMSPHTSSRRQIDLRAMFVLVVLTLCGRNSLADSDEPPITDADREHWAFTHIERATPPEVANSDWCRTSVDRFILAELEERGLQPMPEADRRTLLRRVTFDLTGLPPTLEQIDKFLADESPAAYERVVDRLLASPAYGERWGQHWLDLARFAETDGFEHDKVRPNAWRYRDWVIDALNEDLPYDEFIRLQLAGDEVRPGDPSAAIATGFLLCGPDMPDINLQEERRHNFLNDMTGTVSAVFLGLQTQCASCHHHKYDSISQHDFYRLRAFFDPADIFGERPIPTAEESAAVAEFEKQRAERWKKLEAEMDVLRSDESPEGQKRLETLEADLATLKKSVPPATTMGRVVSNSKRQQGSSRLWIRGDFRRPGDELEPAFLRVANAGGHAVDRDGLSERPDGVRTQLADWLVASDNPLTGRVMVNRLWQHHFGRGLVGTSSDFGVMGEWPTHPELLDWLAGEFMHRGWSLKSMHRLLVTSAVYQTASHDAGDGMPEPASTIAELADADPRNDWLGRMRRKRLDGEAIRDAMLFASGLLNRETGGPGVRPPLPPEVTGTLLKNQWPVTEDEADHRRRSVYLFVRRNLPYPLLAVFDRPDTNQSCPERGTTTIAPQALHLLNSEFALTCAEALADRVRTACPDDDEQQIELAWLLTLGRPPNASEAHLARDFVSSAGPVDVCLGLFNLNEFVYID